MRGIHKRTAVVAAAAVLIVGGGVAYAFWTTGGAGAGTAATGTSVDLVVNQTTVLDPMFPGDTPQTLSGDFDNTSDGTMHVESVTVSIASVDLAGCSAADYTLTSATMAVPQEVVVGAAQGAWTGATIQFNNTTDNQDACKGATVTLAYAVA
jgi:camelysin-like metallo-endopeptidase